MFEDQLQTSVYRALINDEDLMSAVTGVFDCIPQDRMQVSSNAGHYPFLIITEIVTRTDDTKGTYGFRSDVILDGYTIKGGKREAQLIAGHVRRILHDKYLPIDGYQDAYFLLDECQSFQDSDGKCYRCFLRFNSICLLNVGV